MSVEPVPTMRSTITDEAGGLTIVMPGRRFLPFVLFLPLWLIGWAFGEFFAISTLVSGKGGGSAPALFLGLWLTMWTIGGLVAMSLWMWMMFGRERLVVGSGRFVHSYELFGLTRPREYEVQSIRGLRAAPNLFDNARGFRSMTSGAITFDYGAKSVRIGAGLDEAEGRMIVQRIKDRGAVPNAGS